MTRDVADVAPVPMIGLVACGAQKLDRAAPAREIYTSTLFRKSIAYAAQHCDVTYVISAKHGLVDLDHVLEPYDTRIASSALKRLAWSKAIAAELAERHGSAYYLVLAGAAYADPLSVQLKRLLGRDLFVAQPLAGMEIGDRLAFLTAQTIRKAP